jgi:hypothetical protein
LPAHNFHPQTSKENEMAKTTKKQKIADPIFEPGRCVGCFDANVVLADTNGKLWHLDLEKGHLQPVTFKSR